MVTLFPLSVFCTANSCVYSVASMIGVLPPLNMYMVPGPMPRALLFAVPCHAKHEILVEVMAAYVRARAVPDKRWLRSGVGSVYIKMWYRQYGI